MDVAGGRGSLSFELCQKRGIPCTVVDPRLADGVTGTRLTRSQARWVKENGGEGMMEPRKFAALLTPSLWDGGEGHAVAEPAALGHDGSEGTESSDEDGEEGGEGAVGGVPRRWQHTVTCAAPQALPTAELAELRAILRNASAIVGMHPDQATEPIVSCAISLGRPFAVVPCCVFPRTFPDRRLVDDGGGSKPVVTTADFIEFLQRKPSVERDLPRAEKAYLAHAGKNCVVFGGWGGCRR